MGYRTASVLLLSDPATIALRCTYIFSFAFDSVALLSGTVSYAVCLLSFTRSAMTPSVRFLGLRQDQLERLIKSVRKDRQDDNADLTAGEFAQWTERPALFDHIVELCEKPENAPYFCAKQPAEHEELWRMRRQAQSTIRSLQSGAASAPSVVSAGEPAATLSVQGFDVVFVDDTSSRSWALAGVPFRTQDITDEQVCAMYIAFDPYPLCWLELCGCMHLSMHLVLSYKWSRRPETCRKRSHCRSATLGYARISACNVCSLSSTLLEAYADTHRVPCVLPFPLQVIASAGATTTTREQLWCLLHNDWLSDDILGLFFQVSSVRSAIRPEVYICRH